MKKCFSVNANLLFSFGKRMICLGFFLIFTSIAFSQGKKNNKIEEVGKIVSYDLLENGDTINRLDQKNKRQGKWLIVNKGGYGEEDFMELGYFHEDTRMGVWKTFTMDGVIISQEIYKEGNKNGEARYYDEGHLYCIGNYLALRSKFDYDTIMVEDPLTNIEKAVVIKTDVGSVRHGFWTYYEPPSNDVKRVVEYQADEMIYEKEYTAKADSTYIRERMKAFSNGKVRPDAMMLDKNKRLSKFTDFPDDVEYVKPNIRKKNN